MTRKEAKHWLEIELKTWEDECKSKHPIKEAFSVAIKALEQEQVLDKIRAEIKQTSETVDGFLMHDGTKRTVLQILDKYKAESEDKK